MVWQTKPLPSQADRPLWIMAFALLLIAVCLVVLVIKSFFSEQPFSTSSPTDLAETQESSEEPATTSLPPVTSGKRPDRIAETPQLEPSLPALVGLPGGAEPLHPGVPVPNSAGVVPGGFGPLSSLGQTNYRTAIIGRVVLRGTPPPEQPVEAAADAYCASVLPKPLMTHFYVVSTNGGLADVLVRIVEGLSKHPPPAPGTPVPLHFGNCQIGPYVVAVNLRQALSIENKDAVAHVLRLTPQRGRELVTQVKPHATASVLIRSAPELFIPGRCQLHSWETAYVSVLDHPFFSVTDVDGRFSITNIPPGTYLLEAMHQKTHGTNGLMRQITIAPGQILTNNFEFELVPPESAGGERQEQARTGPLQNRF